MKPRIPVQLVPSAQPVVPPPPPRTTSAGRYPPTPPYATWLGVFDNVFWIQASGYLACAGVGEQWRVIHTVEYVCSSQWIQREPAHHHPLYQWLSLQLMR